MERNQPGKYDDIIHLPRPVSSRRAHMSMVDRGAQFSPFAALVGYEAVLEERARLTESETCLEADVKEELSRALWYLSNHLEETSEIRIRCFQRDKRKPGGSYVWHSGKVKKLDLYAGVLLLEDGRKIPLEDIRAINGLEWEHNEP